MSEIKIYPVSKVSGEYTPPGDKSISHRAAMLAALCDGRSVFSHFLASDDCMRTVEAFRQMGVGCELTERAGERQRVRSSRLTVDGVGLKGLRPPKSHLDMGNSGTTMRLALGILAGQSFEATLVGDASLSARPMKRVVEPLRQMGAVIGGRENGHYAPIVIRGGALKGIEWENKIGSAQVKSSVLLAGLFADGTTTVVEPLQTRNHTELLLPLFGADARKSGNRISVGKPSRLNPVEFRVPGDFSSAAFLIAAALAAAESDLLIRDVGLNPTRLGFFEILKQMGARMTIERMHAEGEPSGDLRVRSSRLRGAAVHPDLIPSIIDELPILMVLFALADGTSEIRGARELRVKETDRIKSMTEGLRTIGAKVTELEDGCVIEGARKFKGGKVLSYGDHRTAMSLAVAGLASEEGVCVDDADCIRISYPGFEEDLREICRS